MKASLALATLLLAACVATEHKPAPRAAAPAAAPRSAADEMVAYLAQLRVMNEAAVNAEARRQKAAAAREASDLARVKAALAMTLSNATEENDIVALVEPITRRQNSPTELKAMASFLHEIAGDRRRLKESATAANARSRAAQERATQLQQKLDALTELEKSLTARPTTSR